jgi:hypothetical protein
VNPAALALGALVPLLVARVEALRVRVAAGDGTAWAELVSTADLLLRLEAATAPGAGGALLTTSQLAQRMGVSAKTILRARKRGQLEPAAQLGQRGRAALRWSG